MLVYEISLLIIGLNTFINYCIGSPGGRFSPYEIFSGYTVLLSKRRLGELGLLRQYNQQYNESIVRTNSRAEVRQLKADYKKLLYEAAEPYFTWERAVGMCPVCTGFWVSLGIGLLFTQKVLLLISIIVISHIGIRIFHKWI